MTSRYEGHRARRNSLLLSHFLVKANVLWRFLLALWEIPLFPCSSLPGVLLSWFVETHHDMTLNRKTSTTLYAASRSAHRSRNALQLWTKNTPNILCHFKNIPAWWPETKETFHSEIINPESDLCRNIFPSVLAILANYAWHSAKSSSSLSPLFTFLTYEWTLTFDPLGFKIEPSFTSEHLFALSLSLSLVFSLSSVGIVRLPKDFLFSLLRDISLKFPGSSKAAWTLKNNHGYCWGHRMLPLRSRPLAPSRLLRWLCLSHTPPFYLHPLILGCAPVPSGNFPPLSARKEKPLAAFVEQYFQLSFTPAEYASPVRCISTVPSFSHLVWRYSKLQLYPM